MDKFDKFEREIENGDFFLETNKDYLSLFLLNDGHARHALPKCVYESLFHWHNWTQIKNLVLAPLICRLRLHMFFITVPYPCYHYFSILAVFISLLSFCADFFNPSNSAHISRQIFSSHFFQSLLSFCASSSLFAIVHHHRQKYHIIFLRSINRLHLSIGKH